MLKSAQEQKNTTPIDCECLVPFNYKPTGVALPGGRFWLLNIF